MLETKVMEREKLAKVVEREGNEIARLATRVSLSRMQWFERDDFLKNSRTKAQLMRSLAWLRTELKKDPIHVLHNKNGLANSIRRKFGEVWVANELKTIKIPESMGILNTMQAEVSRWTVDPKNIGLYIKRLQTYAAELKKLGAKYYGEFMKRDTIKHLMSLEEEYRYLGAMRYTDIVGRERSGMMFNAMKAYSGKTKKDWQPFMNMVHDFKSKGRAEFIELFGDTRTADVLVACRKKHYEYPMGWIRVLTWISQVDLPERASSIITAGKEDVLKAVEDIKEIVNKELRKEIKAIDKILKKGIKNVFKQWEKLKDEYLKGETEIISMLIKYSRLTDKTDKLEEEVKAQNDYYFTLLTQQTSVKNWMIKAITYMAEHPEDRSYNKVLLQVSNWVKQQNASQVKPTLDKLDASEEKFLSILRGIESSSKKLIAKFNSFIQKIKETEQMLGIVVYEKATVQTRPKIIPLQAAGTLEKAA